MQSEYLAFVAALLCTSAAVDNAADIKSSPEGCPILGSDVTLLAYFDPSPTSQVDVERSGTILGSCAGTQCFELFPGIEMNAKSAANITLKILSVNQSDAGAWRFSTDRGRNYSDFNMRVSSDLKQVSEDSDLTHCVDASGLSVTFTYTTPCVYSNISISWLLDRTKEITSVVDEIEISDNITYGTCGVVHESKLVVKKYHSIQGGDRISTRLTIEECHNYSSEEGIDFPFVSRSSAGSSSVSVFVVVMAMLLLSATIV